MQQPRSRHQHRRGRENSTTLHATIPSNHKNCTPGGASTHTEEGGLTQSTADYSTNWRVGEITASYESSLIWPNDTAAPTPSSLKLLYPSPMPERSSKKRDQETNQFVTQARNMGTDCLIARVWQRKVSHVRAESCADVIGGECVGSISNFS